MQLHGHAASYTVIVIAEKVDLLGLVDVTGLVGKATILGKAQRAHYHEDRCFTQMVAKYASV